MPRTPLVEINLRAAASSQELHAILMKSLDFPDWYGCNWDAFWDAITALVEMPLEPVLTGWRDFSARLPRDAQLMRECLDDMSRQYPDLASNVSYA